MAWIGDLHSGPIIEMILEFSIKNKITEGIWELSTEIETYKNEVEF